MSYGRKKLLLAYLFSYACIEILMSFFQKSNSIAFSSEEKPGLSTFPQNLNSQQSAIQAPPHPLSNEHANVNTSNSVGLGSTTTSFGNKLSPLPQSVPSNPFQVNSTTAQLHAVGQVGHSQPISRGLVTSTTNSLLEKPLFGNVPGGTSGIKANDMAPQAKLLTRDDFANEAKIVIKKQEEALRLGLQGSQGISSTTAERLEGFSLLRILTELTVATEKNESVFQGLLSDVKAHNEATMSLMHLKKSTADEIAHVKSLNESFTRRKHSILCLFDSIKSASSLLKKEVGPLLSVFYESEDMDLVRESDESTDIKPLNSEIDIGALADANVKATRVKNRLSLIEKFESVVTQIYNSIVAIRAISPYEQRTKPETQTQSSEISVKMLRSIVEHNFQSLFSIWQKAVGIFKKKSMLEEMVRKDFRAVS